MKRPLVKAVESTNANPLITNGFGAPPSVPERQVAIESILAGPPSIYLFKHYWWLTDKPVPQRRNLETNDEYVRLHWRHLTRAARAYVFPSDASTAVISI